MKFAEIIRESGWDPTSFKKSSEIPIKLFDGKDREDQSNTVIYSKPLFAENETSRTEFYNFLAMYLENQNIPSMDVQITQDTVTVFYKTVNAVTFSRRPPENPMDFLG